MKIVFVVSQMLSGGAERVTANLSNEFASLGHSVYIIMINDTNAYSYFTLDKKIKLIPISRIYRKFGIINIAFFINVEIKQIAPDVVISFFYNVSIFSRLAIGRLRIPHIVSERTDPRIEPKGKVLQVLRNYIYRKADGCVFQTDNAMNYFASTIRNKSTVINNPVVLMYEPVEPFEREHKITAAGRLIPAKNYEMMVRAFALFLEKHPDYKLVIYGDGKMRGEIENLIKDLKLTNNVSLMGLVENLHQFIYNSTIFALSSNHEGMPNALLEAMALGVPSVATDCPIGGPAQIIKNGENGILIPVGNVNAMADAFVKIANDEKYAKSLSKKSKKIKEAFSVVDIAAKWLDYINDVISKKNNNCN